MHKHKNDLGSQVTASQKQPDRGPLFQNELRVPIPRYVGVELPEYPGQWVDISKFASLLGGSKDSFYFHHLEEASDLEQQAIDALINGDQPLVRYGYWGKVKNHPYTLFRCLSLTPASHDLWEIEPEVLEQAFFDETAGNFVYQGDNYMLRHLDARRIR